VATYRLAKCTRSELGLSWIKEYGTTGYPTTVRVLAWGPRAASAGRLRCKSRSRRVHGSCFPAVPPWPTRRAASPTRPTPASRSASCSSSSNRCVVTQHHSHQRRAVAHAAASLASRVSPWAQTLIDLASPPLHLQPALHTAPHIRGTSPHDAHRVSMSRCKKFTSPTTPSSPPQTWSPPKSDPRPKASTAGTRHTPRPLHTPPLLHVDTCRMPVRT
jgi:hypothetical protein